jgi:16S rRNA (adenine1518-N6/adenine1519-N6)-dimethyltransferase
MARIPNFIHNTEIGQNFLIDHSIVDFMIARAKLTPADRVLEIGPGEGILTEGSFRPNVRGYAPWSLTRG